jgi:hypothetical protein
VNRRRFLLGSIGAALSAGMTLPEFEQREMVGVIERGESHIVIDCGGMSLREVYEHVKFITRRAV